MLDARLGRPGQAVRPIAKIGDLECRRLVAAAADPTTDDEKLLVQYSPELVNLPDIESGAPRPYPSGTSDYQPNAVDSYMGAIRTVRQMPRGWLRRANVVYTGLSYILVIAPVLLAFLAAEAVVLGAALAVAVVNTLVANVILVPTFRWAGTPTSRADLRDRCREPDWAAKYATTVFPRRTVGDPALAWSQYGKAASSPDGAATVGRKVVYGRVQEDGGLKVLQYWLFFYYNDWWNRHEADWEVVMVYLDAANRPLTVACSSHLSGQWRPWAAVEPAGTDKFHPRVYVARGSHALYFNVAGGSHYAVLRQPWAIFDLSGQLMFRGQKDAVGPDTLASDEYELIVIPRDAENVVPDSEEWDRWWWLRFAGRWGSTDGVLSPPLQEGGRRWGHPVEWARDRCEADSSSWDEAVTATASPGGTP